MTISAEHIPGIVNVQADREKFEASDWSLNPQVFQRIQQTWGKLEIDLFAARHNTKLPHYFSYRPDPQAEAIDAMTQDWSRLKGYAFPPFIIIGRILMKVRQDKMKELVLIAPMRKSQVWYPLLLNNLMDTQLLLPNSCDLILNPAGESRPLIQQDRLQLAALRVSGIESRVREFQKGLSQLYPQHAGKGHRSRISQRGTDGVIGVVNGTPILSQPL